MNAADIRIILGKSGSGKTNTVRNIIAGADRVIIFDAKGGDYKDGVVFYDMKELARFWLKHKAGRFRLIYRPVFCYDEFETLAELAYKCGDLWFVAEEMDIYYPSTRIGFWGAMILRRGRSRGIHFIGCTQRPKRVNRDVTSQATEAYIFKTTEPGDIDYIKEWLGSDIESQIKTLGAYEYVRCIGTDNKEIRKDPYL